MPSEISRHFGIISPPVPGHINPFTALGRELKSRGHRVTIFHMADIAEKVRAEGIEFETIGQSDHPPGALADFRRRLGLLDGFAALRHTIEAARRSTIMFLRDGPGALERAGVDALLVDQTEPSGGTLAEHLGIPFYTICCALAINREPGVPPAFSPLPYSEAWWAPWRNRIAYAVSDAITAPVLNEVNRYRKRWSLRPYRISDDSFSPLAQIAQQPPGFDFPRKELPPHFHYAGPLRSPSPVRIDFPWDKLDGRPMVYASLGTLQGSKAHLFHIFAEACRELDVQLVISHGHALEERSVAELSKSAIVVPYAPQAEVLARAAVTVTHGGLNTVLDSLTHGLPMVVIPLTFEQPAIAQRVRWLRAGVILKLQQCRALSVRTAIAKALNRKELLSPIALQRPLGVERARCILLGK